MCITLGYAWKNMGGTYFMLNLHTKCAVLSLDSIWINKIMSSAYQYDSTPSLKLKPSKEKMILINGQT